MSWTFKLSLFLKVSLWYFLLAFNAKTVRLVPKIYNLVCNDFELFH